MKPSGWPSLDWLLGKSRDRVDEGEFHDQGDAKWIVIRQQLRGHNDTPCGRPAPSRPVSRPESGQPQGVSGMYIIREPLRGHNVSPVGRPDPMHPTSRSCAGRPQGEFGILVLEFVFWNFYCSRSASSTVAATLLCTLLRT
jgi:hypothetical protein